MRSNYYKTAERGHCTPWSGSKWVRFSRRDRIPPGFPGCYVIYADGELVYIGQAVNVRQRLAGHGYLLNTTLAGKETSFAVRFGERAGDWSMREYRLLTRLRPSQNAVFGSRVPRRFNKAMGEF